MPAPLIQDPATAARLASMSRRMDLGSALRGLDDGLSELLAAPGQLSGLRAAGWRWFSKLEAELVDLQRALPQAKSSALFQRDQLVAPLKARFQQLQAQAQRPGDAAAMASALFRLDQDLVIAERALLAVSQAALERSVALRDRLVMGRRALDRFGDAGFKLGPGERPMMAFDANWVEAPSTPETPVGVLLLSDQRLRFERRDDRVLRRNLGGLAIETHVDRTLLLDEPHGSVGGATDASGVGLNRRPAVALSWKAGALVGKKSTFALNGGALELVAAAEALRQGRAAAYA